MRQELVEEIAKFLMKSYCPLSWPIAWNTATEKTKNGWRRTARALVKKFVRPSRDGAGTICLAHGTKCLCCGVLKNEIR